MSNQMSEWVRAFAAPRWFRAAIAALLLVAFGVGIGLRVGAPVAPLAPVAPGGQTATTAPGLNLPPLSVEGRRFTPEPVPTATVTPPSLTTPADGASPPPAAGIPAVPADASLAVAVDPSVPPPEPDLTGESAPAAADGGRPPPPTWRDIQNDMFGGDRP